MKGVTLKIKSPSALMADLEVEVELEDTVLQVKEQIAVSYPTRPPTSEQKLVYLGKILRDTDVLEEVLRLEEGVDMHTLHLVCAIPRRQEGEVRYRPAPAPLAALQEAAVPPPATYSPPSGQDNMEEMMRTFSSQYTAAMTSLPPSPSQEEVAALQELYTQYLGLYMQYLAGQGSALQYQHLLPAPAPAPAPAGVQEAAAQVVQGPADGMVMNAGGGGAVAAEAAGGDRNRDILDWVYVMTRVMLLFSVIYFHSSFWRLAFVAGLGFLVFLYQTRQQGRRRQQAPAPAPAPAPPPVQHEGEEEEEEEEGEGEEGDETAPLVVEQPKPSGVAVVVTFFTSLISSIIPEQNHVI